MCGANGSRTRVQTRNTYAFYTFILALIFVRRQDPSHQPPAYLLDFRYHIAACDTYSVYFCAAKSFSPQTRLGATSRSSAWRPKKLIYYTSIRQREHKKYCQLCFEARLTSVASLLGVLTQPFYLLSKPNSPSRELRLYTIRDHRRSYEFSPCSRSPQKLKFPGTPRISFLESGCKSTAFF